MTKETSSAHTQSRAFLFVWLLLGAILLILGIRQLADPTWPAWNIWLAFIGSALFLVVATGEWMRQRRHSGMSESDGPTA